ncbi:hypothetical protein EDC04DRAFT_2940434 [Pisolithus marmoratus]|nr:hypothetical protein EDC04DRAFT_2940434 [Pisolithus marmoratus]
MDLLPRLGPRRWQTVGVTDKRDYSHPKIWRVGRSIEADVFFRHDKYHRYVRSDISSRRQRMVFPSQGFAMWHDLEMCVGEEESLSDAMKARCIPFSGFVGRERHGMGPKPEALKVQHPQMWWHVGSRNVGALDSILGVVARVAFMATPLRVVFQTTGTSEWATPSVTLRRQHQARKRTYSDKATRSKKAGDPPFRLSSEASWVLDGMTVPQQGTTRKIRKRDDLVSASGQTWIQP